MRRWVWIGWIVLLFTAACMPPSTEPTATQPLVVATNTPIPPQPFVAATAPSGLVVEPTAVYQPFAGCPGTPPSRLIVLERGQVTPGDETLNLREGPGTDFPVRTRIQPEEFFFVIDGPTCSDGYTWYQIRYRSFEGWIAEGDQEEYYARPYLPG